METSAKEGSNIEESLVELSRFDLHLISVLKMKISLFLTL